MTRSQKNIQKSVELFLYGRCVVTILLLHERKSICIKLLCPPPKFLDSARVDVESVRRVLTERIGVAVDENLVLPKEDGIHIEIIHVVFPPMEF